MKNKIRAWMLFDFAAQPFHTLVVSFLFIPYFNQVIAGGGTTGQILVSVAGVISALLVAILAPIISSIVDQAGHRKRWVIFFTGLFAISCCGLLLEKSVITVLLAYAIAYSAIEMLLVTMNAYLPDFQKDGHIGKISGDAWGYGYIGGLILLIAFVLFLLPVEGSSTTLFGFTAILGQNGPIWTGPASAIWLILFMIPFFILFKNEKGTKSGRDAIQTGLASLQKSGLLAWNDLRLRWFFISSLVFRDALAGLFIFGAIYAQNVLGWPIMAMTPFSVGIYGIVLNITGIIGGVGGGTLDRKFGSHAVVRWSIYLFILLCFVMMSTNRESILFIPVDPSSTLPDWVFFICGMLIGIGVGAIQGASRGMVVPETEGKMLSGEAFGIYGMMGRATAFIAPILVGLFTAISGNAQFGVWPIFGLFVISAICFRKFEKTTG